ncbi:MAG TPA: hypothetical protein VNR90_08320, partial [Vicinamibacterales bacterium]|nr:hypothetical protein [Vicinamibacterales bacterium]
MPPVAASRTRHGAKPLDDFEWPPTADELSVYELGPDPWQKLQDASSQVFVARRREASQRRLMRVVDRAPQPARRYWTLTRALVLAGSAVVAMAAGWFLYGAAARPLPVNAIHHPVPPAAVITAPAPPPAITIVATYPVEPAAPSTALVDREAGAAPGAAGPIAPDPESAGQAAPVDPPVAGETMAAPADTATPAGTPSAVDPGAQPPDGVGPAPDAPGTGLGPR